MPMFHRPVFAFVLLLAVAGYARAEEEDVNPDSPEAPLPSGSITIDGQKLEVYLDRKMHAIGNAEMHQDDKAIYGDRIDYDLLNGELHAAGNSRIEWSGLTVTGPDLRLKVQEREGEMQEPVFTMRTANKAPVTEKLRSDGALVAAKPGMPTFSRGSAKQVVFDGQGREVLKNATYTSCAVGVDDWYMHAKELELDHNTDTATAKHASVEFKGVPIFYTPWIAFSFSNQRQSGLLAPLWSTSTRTGFDFSVPYYWNIAPNRDATITPRYMTKRGYQTGVEFRYLEPNYSGQDNLEYMAHDDQLGKDRYYYNLKHRHAFGKGWSGNVSYERVSDDKYFSDMTTHITSTSRVVLPQQATINYGSEHWNFNGLVQTFQTLDGQSYPYQRLPQLTLTGNKDWDWVTGNLYSQWVSFGRSSDAPAQQSYSYAPGSSVTTGVKGSRFTSYPSITIPVTVPFGYVTPKMGLHYSRYNLSDPGYTLNSGGATTTGNYGSDSRVLPIFSMDSGVYFDRDMRVVRNRYTQTLEPRLFYVYIPNENQSNLPVFDTAEADLNQATLFSENQYTGNDRINNANQLSAALTSRLIDQNTGVQRLSATVGQRFYFTDQKVTLPGETPRSGNTSDIIAGLSARLLNHWNADGFWQYNTDTSRMYKANLGARYNPAPGKTLNLSYRYTRSNLEQIDLSSQWPLGRNFFAIGRYNYSLRENRLIEGIAGAEYDGGCWQARGVMQRVETATAGTNTAYFFQLVLGGLSSIGSSPLKLLTRSIPGYRTTDLVPDDLD